MARTTAGIVIVLLLSLQQAIAEPRRKRVLRHGSRMEAAQRRIYAQDDAQHAAGRCNNTQQGRWQLTDDRGYVCDRSDLDYTTGCCSAGQQFTCQTCGKDDHCCAVYEHCVSCCMAPESGMQPQVYLSYRATGRPDTGQWDSLFQMCQGRCRTSSNSTVHENDYVARRHYCFKEYGRPLVPPLPQHGPDALSLVRGRKGEDCDTVCAGAGDPSSSASEDDSSAAGGADSGMACAQQYFPQANNCNMMRLHFICQAGCEDSEGHDQPSYVAQDAPKSHRPTMCFVSMPSGSPADSFACNGSHPHTERLCPCVPASGASDN